MNFNQILFYISAICWEDVNNEEKITNVKDLPKTMYVEIPADVLKEKEDHVLVREINDRLYKSTNVKPWYYNIDYVCEI